jgi:hypothetical protein
MVWCNAQPDAGPGRGWLELYSTTQALYTRRSIYGCQMATGKPYAIASAFNPIRGKINDRHTFTCSKAEIMHAWNASRTCLKQDFSKVQGHWVTRDISAILWEWKGRQLLPFSEGQVAIILDVVSHAGLSRSG